MTILNLTPSWSQVLDVLILGIEAGGEAEKIARYQLERMARLADKYAKEHEQENA